ncbi:Carbohydrate-binding module family 5/12 [uncultured Caudovirales phage]|uniref:Carbohydrate-binding module family 5/12 n=1 Tax=uncultured Caudovirales phage TaxID=2100421 RepID=A0A6J7X2G7_9CAUD|nr:Carbohydrate-binding module family 5/12 [uncultured Caudovirales phage]
MAKTVGTSNLLEVIGSDRAGQGAPALVTPALGTIEGGFVAGVASSNNFTWAHNQAMAAINHILQNGVPLWNATTAYAAGNVVSHTNTIWVCLVANTNSAPTGVNTNWVAVPTVATTAGIDTRLAIVEALPLPFATVNFNGTASANLTGTYTQSGTTVTVTATAHGHQVGHKIQAVITSGTAVANYYTVATVPTANTFTYTAGTSLTTSGNITLTRLAIRAQTGVHSVVPRDNAIGNGVVRFNFSTAATNINFVPTNTNYRQGSNSSGWVSPHRYTAFDAPDVWGMTVSLLDTGFTGVTTDHTYSMWTFNRCGV